MSLHVLCAPSRRRGFVAEVVVSDDLLFAVGGQGSDPTLLVSSDARHWSSVPTPGRGLRSLVAGDGLVVCGEYGLVARSADLGESWDTVELPEGGCQYTVVAHEGALWIGGDGGRLWRWDDEGFAAVASGMSGRILSLASIGGELWLVGDGGLWRGGEHVLATSQPLCGLCSVGGALVAVGDGGQVWRSTGEAFSAVEGVTHLDLEDVVALADGRVVAVGGRGTVLVSSDAGATWIGVGSGTAALWSVAAFGGGAVVGGADGLVLWLGSLDELPWGERVDRFGTGVADGFFADGPEGFLDRLEDWVGVRCGPLEERAAAASGPEELDASELSGEDAWRGPAWRVARGLWTGSTADVSGLWGAEPPPELVGFERATTRAETWSTFEELRLDARLMAEPGPDVNVFEQIVLSDQLNYLGTALPEVFSGAVCFGTLGNGDSWHLELLGDDRTVLLWNHETHGFEVTAAPGLEPVLYLAALAASHDDELVSDEVAAAGYAALRGRVAPPWHFSIGERDEDFEAYEHPGDQRRVEFYWYRSAWIQQLLKADGIRSVDALAEVFHEHLNPVLPEEHYDGRLEAAGRMVPTALYAVWRAYLFEEPLFERLMEVGQGHPARIVRDAVRLIEELQVGRKELGRIADWPRVLERFRALDLDPLRATEREAEAAAAAEAARGRASELVAQVQGSSGAALEELVWGAVQDRVARPTLFEALELDDGFRRAIEFLRDQGYCRHDQIYRDEEHDACAWAARHLGALGQALVVGECLWPAPREEGEPVVVSHAWDVLLRVARGGGLAPRAVAVVAAWMREASMEDGPDFRVRRAVAVLGWAGGAEGALAGLLAGVPAEGGFETSLTWDDFVGEVADAMARVGDVAGVEALVPFASSPAQRMRDARTGAARAVARLAPERGTRAMLDNLVEMTTKINDGPENAEAFVAVARMAPFVATEGLLDQILAAESYGLSKVEVALARALAVRALGGPDEVAGWVSKAATEPAWKHEYTVRRRRFVLSLRDLVEVPVEAMAGWLRLGDEVLSLETWAALEDLGVEVSLPRRLSWFEVQELSDEELAAALADGAVGNRQHAARLLGSRGVRAPLVAAVRGVMERASTEPGRDLDVADDRIMREAIRGLRAGADEATLALFADMLVHPSRDVKDPVLRDPPGDVRLLEGMKQVAAEKWGWQERVAVAWLEEHG